MKVKLYEPKSEEPPEILLRLVKNHISGKLVLARVGTDGNILDAGRLIEIDCTTGRFRRVWNAKVPDLDFDSDGRIIISN